MFPGHAVAAGTLAILLAVPASASADRSGDGPVAAPNASRDRHVAFTLKGSGWGQVVGATGATPSLGAYARDLALPGRCTVTVRVRATAAHHRPTVRGDTVQVRPPIRLKNNRLVYTRRGRHGPITWWLGHRDGSDVAVAGFQRAPRSIARAGTPWLLYEVSIGHQPQSGDRASCSKAAHTAMPAVALAVARTMHLADGAPKAKEPFTTA